MPANQDPYSFYFTVSGLAALQDEALALAAVLDADGAPAQASRVRQAFIKLLAELNSIATTVAAFAEEEIKSVEESSRVRSDTGGGGGPRLNDYVGRSHPLSAVEGSVGVNFEPDLYAAVPWWWTNEEGYSGHEGRVLKGFFEPGHAKPASDQFREHPLFTASGGPKGIINNPIPARHFVERGGKRAEVKWHALIQAAKRTFVAECDRALAAAPPSRRRGKGRLPRATP